MWSAAAGQTDDQRRRRPLNGGHLNGPSVDARGKYMKVGRTLFGGRCAMLTGVYMGWFRALCICCLYRLYKPEPERATQPNKGVLCAGRGSFLCCACFCCRDENGPAGASQVCAPLNVII